MMSNTTNATIGQFKIPKTHLYTVLTLYGFISFTSVIGNSMVLISFFKSSKIRNSRTNHLIVSLSCADLIAGAITVPLYANLMMNNFEGYNESVQFFIYQVIDVFSVTASIWHLAVISLDRYVRYLCYVTVLWWVPFFLVYIFNISSTVTNENTNSQQIW